MLIQVRLSYYLVLQKCDGKPKDKLMRGHSKIKIFCDAVRTCTSQYEVVGEPGTNGL